MIFQIDAWLFWLILVAAFLIAEAMTVNLTTIWFAFGSFVAMVFDLAGLSVKSQFIAMIIVSGLLLAAFVLLIRPRLAVGWNKQLPLYSGRLIGQQAIVTERIDPQQGTGLIQAKGQTWSAVSGDQQTVEVNTPVEIVDIRGMKVIIKVKEPD